jgi:hypothetical protein
LEIEMPQLGDFRLRDDPITQSPDEKGAHRWPPFYY